MKKALCFVLAVAICAVFSACAGSPDGRSGYSRAKSVDDVLNSEMEKVDKEKQSTTRSSAEPVKTRPAEELPPEYKTVDIDLTKLSSTMVYSEVNDMTSSPEGYVGKTVRMSGAFTYTPGEGRNYYACLIADATACCAQGIEFVLKKERAFPEEYPKDGEEISVVGVFDTYYEGSYLYCQLKDAYIE